MAGFVQIVIDDSTNKTIQGLYDFDRDNGGMLCIPAGSSFPGTPEAKELFWRIDEKKLYRRNDGDTAWDAVEGLDSTAVHKATAGEIAAITEKVTPVSTDVLLIEDSAAANVKKRVQVGNLPGGGGGEANTASNVGTGGVGIFKEKSGVDLRFKKLNAGSAKVSIADDTDNDEVDVDVNTGVTASTVCVGNDIRLSDARTPTSHASSHNAGGGDALAIDAAAGTGSLRTIGTGSLTACAGDDSRLSDARTPSSHAASHNAGGGDALAIDAAAGTGSLRTIGTGSLTACAGDDSRLSDGRNDGDAIHDNVAAEISALTEKVTPVSADLIIIEDSAAANAKKKVQVGNLPGGGGGETNTASNVGTAGVGVFKTKSGVDLQFKKINAGSAKVTITDDTGSDEVDVDVATGTTSATVCVGNDSRLSDARTPTTHATSHKSGGGDAIKLDELAAPTDITTLDATTSLHGLLPRLGGGTTNFLRADGAWAAPAGGGGGYPIHVIPAAAFDPAHTTDWQVPTPAILTPDTLKEAIGVLRFDDSLNEGRGFTIPTPTGATNVIFTIWSRPQTAPGSAKVVKLRLYNREFVDTAAMEAWTYDALGDVAITTNTNWMKDAYTISFSTLGATAGNPMQFEFTRNAMDAGDTLVGDWNLALLVVSFS